MPIRLYRDVEVKNCYNCPFVQPPGIIEGRCTLAKKPFSNRVVPQTPPTWCPMRKSSVRIDTRVRYKPVRPDD